MWLLYPNLCCGVALSQFAYSCCKQLEISGVLVFSKFEIIEIFRYVPCFFVTEFGILLWKLNIKDPFLKSNSWSKYIAYVAVMQYLDSCSLVCSCIKQHYPSLCTSIKSCTCHNKQPWTTNFRPSSRNDWKCSKFLLGHLSQNFYFFMSKHLWSLTRYKKKIVIFHQSMFYSSEKNVAIA